MHEKKLDSFFPQCCGGWPLHNGPHGNNQFNLKFARTGITTNMQQQKSSNFLIGTAVT